MTHSPRFQTEQSIKLCLSESLWQVAHAVRPGRVYLMESLIGNDLLPRILSMLRSPWDLARASAVCKSWRVASSEVCPTRLAIHSRTAGYGVHTQMRRWFQTQFRQGRLVNLNKIQMCAGAKDLRPSSSELQDTKTVQTLFTCVMELLGQTNLLGFSNLQVCWLEGLVPLEDAFRSLPACLRELCIWTDTPGQYIMSSHLGRLRKLECLTLRMGGGQPNFCFQVDQDWPNLRILRLAQGQLILTEDGPFPAALPQLTA